MRSRQSLDKVMRLSRAINVRYERDIAFFEQANAKVSKIELEIDLLRGRLSYQSIDGGFDIAEMKAAGVHRRWIEQQIRNLNLKLARALVEKESARHLFAISAARRETVKRLLDG